MAKFAVVELGKSQYNITEGKEYKLPRFNIGSGKVSLDKVMLAGDEKSMVVGKPFLDKAVVEIEITGVVNGEKVTSRTFKAKSRYRKTKGFRKELTQFKVLSIKF